jgi:hypothetical protein
MDPINPNPPFSPNPVAPPVQPPVQPVVTPPPVQTYEQPIITPPTPPKKGSSLVSFLLSVILLIVVAGVFYYLGTQKLFGEVPIPSLLQPAPTPLQVKMSPKPLVSPLPSAAPEATGSSGLESSSSAWVNSYNNPKYGYSIRFPDDLEISQKDLINAPYSVILNEKKPPEGPTFPILYVSVIPDGFTNKNAEVYNFLDSKIIDNFYTMTVGDTKATQESDPGFFTFKKLQDITVAGNRAIVMESDKVWEGESGLKDRRVFIRRGGYTYMIGAYYKTQTELNNFQAFLQNFKFVK